MRQTVVLLRAPNVCGGGRVPEDTKCGRPVVNGVFPGTCKTDCSGGGGGGGSGSGNACSTLGKCEGKQLTCPQDQACNPATGECVELGIPVSCVSGVSFATCVSNKTGTTSNRSQICSPGKCQSQNVGPCQNGKCAGDPELLCTSSEDCKNVPYTCCCVSD